MAIQKKQRMWLYQARRVNTQSNVAGGALVTRISLPSGVTARIVGASYTGPATNSTNHIYLLDEDAAVGPMLATAAAANATFSLPSIGSTAGSTANTANSAEIRLAPGQFIRFYATTVAQTETQTIGISLLLSVPVEPTWDTTGSGGTPSLAASTISAANTLQAVYV